MNNEIRAKNAIKWIENLPSYKQAPKEDRIRLGSNERGYCCIGAGCEILEIAFEADHFVSDEFQYAVGLRSRQGSFTKGYDYQVFYEETSLAAINDNTDAGFKLIADLMKRHPDWMFHDEVAPLIAKHFA